jgi:hypothetical protein
MAGFTALVPDIQVEIPEIPTFVAERQLVRALRELCEEARVWRISFTINTTADVPTILLSSYMPLGTELVDIVSMKNSSGGEPLAPTTYIKMDKNHTDWRNESNSDASKYMLDTNNTIRLYPTPTDTIDRKYNVRAAIKPQLAVVDIDELVLNKYSEILISGALSRLYALPRKPWTDLQQSALHRAIFYSGFAAARTEAAEEFQTGVSRKVKYGGI